MATMFSGLRYCALTGVTVTDRVLGHGSYATVFELECNGHKCAGKKIHDVLIAQGMSTYSLQKFEKECQLLSELHHPNIVEFLGVYFQDQSQPPILVMEYLSTDLSSYIAKSGILPQEISYSILHDVAKGLDYLHNRHPPVIHRDLTCNNILLTSDMAAKISDLGVARIVDLPPQQVSCMTQTPGTPAYMPPEVMVANARYDVSVDEFSYGILIVHILSGEWPEPHVEPNRVEEDKLIPVSEAERRMHFLDAIGHDHPLMGLVLSCLNNNPQLRPHSGDILMHLEDMVKLFPRVIASQSKEFAFADTLPGRMTKRGGVDLKAKTQNSTLPRRTKARKPDIVESDQTSDVNESEMSLDKGWSKAKTLFARKAKQKPVPKGLPSPQGPVPVSCTNPLCVALCTFHKTEAKELSFNRGDLLHIICDKHRWWFVQSQETGDQGFIPSNFVIKLPHGEEIPQNKIHLTEKVGESKFSYVCKGRMYEVLPVTVKISKPMYARHSHEAGILLSLKHPNIIQLYGVCSARVPMLTILEYMKHGSLSDYLREGEGKSLTPPQLINMASQVAAGMTYLEHQKYVHRDLAARNVLVRENMICKVANFDSAQAAREDEYMVLFRVEASIKWAAPECLLCNTFTIKSDVWSFGVVLYEIMTHGRHPYPGLTNAQVVEQVRQGHRMARPLGCPEALYDIMLNCWKKEPEPRPTFETLQWQLEEFFVS